MAILGADPNDLDDAARTFDDARNSLEHVILNGDRAVRAVWWIGLGADNFRSSWNSRDMRELRAAVAALDGMGNRLRSQANQQRNASKNMGDTGARRIPTRPVVDRAPSPTDDRDPAEELEDDLQWLKDLLEKLGLGKDIWEGLVKGLRHVDPDLLKLVGNTVADNLWIVDVAKSLDGFMDLGGAVINLVEDLAQQLGEGLPVDEAVLHAVVEAGTIFAGEQAIEAVVKKVTPLLIGSLTGGVGAIPGAAFGWILGEGAGLIAKQILDAGGGEFVGDIAVETYRAVRDAATQMIDVVNGMIAAGEVMIDVTIEAGKLIIDGVEAGVDILVDIGGEIVEFGTDVIEFGGDVIEGIGNVGEDIWNFVF